MTDKVEKDGNVTFQSLGLCGDLCTACESMKWKKPTDIQKVAIPPALEGHDIIGVSQTGSGKTGAYALPILNDLFRKPRQYFALILTPTRELTEQVAEQINILGSSINIRCAVVIGGEDNSTQVICLASKPHIIIATPGRLLDHLSTTQGFRLDLLRYLVFDEADRILAAGFEEEINEILKKVPKNRKTFLFSATMTKKVEKLQGVSLKDPIRLEITARYEVPSTLEQKMILVPNVIKECYLYYITLVTTHDKDISTIIFCNLWHIVRLLTFTLRNLGISAVALYGQMTQEKRAKALEKFKRRECQVLVATDVASRGLDIPSVERIIINDVPKSPAEYIHRVGRTARAGKKGVSYILCTEYEISEYLEIEKLLGYKIEQCKPIRDNVLAFKPKLDDALKAAKKQIKEKEKAKKRARDGEEDDDDTEEATGIRMKLSKKNKQSLTDP